MGVHRAAKTIITLATAILAIMFGLGIEYLLALAGEPGALWLMRDILGWL